MEGFIENSTTLYKANSLQDTLQWGYLGTHRRVTNEDVLKRSYKQGLGGHFSGDGELSFKFHSDNQDQTNRQGPH